MRRTLAILTLLFAVSLFVSSQTPPENSQKPLYKPTGTEASVIGSILFDDDVPERKKIDMSADEICAEMNQPHGLTDYLIVTNKALLDTVVYVKSGETLNNYRFDVPESEVRLEFKGCRMSPHVLALRVGQRLSIVNSDGTVHNTHPKPRINQEWNMSQAPGASPFGKSFTSPEQFFPLKCNHHPWERAVVGVFAHPFFAVSDQLGNYEIRGLPPGTYKLVVWHEGLGDKDVEITVAAGENKRVDFTFEIGEIRSSLSPEN